MEGCDDDGKSGRSDDRRKAVMMTGSTEDGAREFAASGRTTAGTGTGVPRATAKQRAARIRELRRQKAPADKTQELPIDEGYSKTFLRVTVAVAVFLFAITLAGVLGINSMFENSRQQVVSNFIGTGFAAAGNRCQPERPAGRGRLSGKISRRGAGYGIERRGTAGAAGAMARQQR